MPYVRVGILVMRFSGVYQWRQSRGYPYATARDEPYDLYLVAHVLSRSLGELDSAQYRYSRLDLELFWLVSCRCWRLDSHVDRWAHQQRLLRPVGRCYVWLTS